MSTVNNLKIVSAEAPAALAAAAAAKLAAEEPQNSSTPAHDALVVAATTKDVAEESILTVDFEKLRADNQDYENSVGTKVITTVLVSKPGKQTFFRVNPDPKWKMQTNILELRGDKTESFLLAPSLGAELAAETVRVELYSCITRQNTFFLWPVKVPGTDGRLNSWHVSAVEAARVAMTKWVRVGANMEARAYDVTQATGNFPDPEWPTSKSFQDLVRLAFKDRYITNADHPVVRALRGRV